MNAREATVTLDFVLNILNMPSSFLPGVTIYLFAPLGVQIFVSFYAVALKYFWRQFLILLIW